MEYRRESAAAAIVFRFVLESIREKAFVTHFLSILMSLAFAPIVEEGMRWERALEVRFDEDKNL